MKKIVSLLFLSALVCSAVVTSGCTKKEQVLAGAAAVSACGAGVSFLRHHENRNIVRKKDAKAMTYEQIKVANNTK